MAYLKPLRLACILLAILATLAARTAGATTTPTTNPAIKCGQWNVVPSPSPYQNGNRLNAVAAVSAKDVWAVGYGGPEITLIEHWNGNKWSAVSSPSPGSYDVLNSVAAISSKDVWAVGEYSPKTPTFIDLALIEHWDGSRWSVVPSPNPGGVFSQLSSVVGLSANDIWAVGSYKQTAYTPEQSGYIPFRTLIEHWNGSRWSIVPSPNQGSHDSYLNGVTAISSTDVLAVGDYWNSNQLAWYTLTQQWNGSKWSIIPSPSSGSPALLGVTAINASDVWAIGSAQGLPLTEYWNGSHWRIVKSPTPPNSDGGAAFTGVAASGANDVWSVGWGNTGGEIGNDFGFIEHWNGKIWQNVPSPTVATDWDFYGVAMTSPHNIWAVGTYDNVNGGPSYTLIEYYC